MKRKVKKLSAILLALFVALMGFVRVSAAGSILSIDNVTVAEKSNDAVQGSISFGTDNIITDAVLAKPNSFIKYSIKLKNNSSERYKITDASDDLSIDFVESAYSFGSDYIDAGGTATLTATYRYVVEQDTGNNDTISLGDITITLTLEDVEGNAVNGAGNPSTGDQILFFAAVFVLSFVAMIFVLKKRPKGSAIIACLVSILALGTFLVSSTIAGSTGVRLYLRGISVAPKEVPHVVVFNANSGLGDMDQQVIALNAPQNLNANTFRRNYFSFTGWNTAADGSGDSYADGASVSFSEGGETTLYAQWTTDRSIAFLDVGETINRKMKEFSGVHVPDGSTSSVDPVFNTRLTGVYTVAKADALPDGFDTEDEAYIISAPESPYKIHAWKQNSTIYIYTDAEIIKGNKNMDKTFVNFYNTGNFSAVADWDMSETEIFSSMFAVNNSLTTTNVLANWDTSSAKSLYRIFYRNFNLYSVDGLAKWNTSKVTNLSLAFYWSRLSSNSLHSLATTDRGDYTSWDVSNVTNMSMTFGSMEGYSFTNLDGIANWNTSNVTNMSGMFGSNDRLTDISALATTDRGGYTSWDVSNVKNMNSILDSNPLLYSLHGIENWDVSNVETLERAFYHDTALKDISALSNWKLDNVKTIKDIFDHDEKLTDISPLANWDTSNIEDMSGAFSYAKTLSDISPVSTWNTSNVKDLSSMFRHTAITNINALTTTQRDGYKSWDVSNVEKLSAVFWEDNQLTDISGIANWDTSSATTLSYLFSQTAITDTDALRPTQRDGYKSWDVSNVTTLDSTFREITTLTDLNGIAEWDVSKVSSMYYTFYMDSGLTYVRMLDAWHPAENLRCISTFSGTGTNNYPEWAN